jgi:hypothetical protein
LYIHGIMVLYHQSAARKIWTLPINTPLYDNIKKRNVGYRMKHPVGWRQRVEDVLFTMYFTVQYVIYSGYYLV